jgi:cell division protein FtsW
MAAEATQARPETDRWLLLIAVLLLGAGLVMVLSSSQAFAYLQRRSPFYYFERQAVAMLIGVAALLALRKLDYHRLRSLAKPAAAAVVLLMLLVLIPHIGVNVNGARRWFNLGPLGTLQPSELGKLVLAVFIADWIDRRGARLATFADGFVPFVILMAGAMALIMLQRDLGTALVTASIFVGAYFTGGGRKRYLAMLFAGLVVMFVLFTVLEPYRVARLASFTDPFSDRLGTGFQSTQALLALGSGGLTGVGLGHSVEKFLWLPEAHTDFIFAIIGEEIGLLGTTLVLAGFVAFCVRGYRAAIRAPDRFGLVLASAITTWIGFQALVNMATVTDTLPITGVPLPFISYGGTSVAITLAAVGVLLNIAGQGTRQTYRESFRRIDATFDIGRRNRRPPVSGARRRAGVSR